MGPYFSRRRSALTPTSDAETQDWGSRIIRKLGATSAASERDKPYHHGDLRKALLAATLELIEEHGPQGFTLRGAARRAGVTPGATYHHFEDKEDLVAALAQESLDLLWQRLRAASQKQVHSARERARNVGVAYVLFAVEQPTRFRVMLGYGLLPRKGSDSSELRAMEAYRFVHDLLVTDLAKDRGEGVSEAEVLGWWSVVHGLAFLAIDGPLSRSVQNRGHVENVVRAVFDALDRRGSTSTNPLGRAKGA